MSKLLDAFIEKEGTIQEWGEEEIEHYHTALGHFTTGWDAQKKEVENQLKEIPAGNFYYADRYDTDDEIVLHLWDAKDENSFDIRISKG